MRLMKFLLIFPFLIVVPPAPAADGAAPENPEANKPEDSPVRADRPQREAVKLSPSVRESAPRPDESGEMKRVAPPRSESPLQHVPALMDPPPEVPSR